jgi:hypothetical protein
VCAGARRARRHRQMARADVQQLLALLPRPWLDDVRELAALEAACRQALGEAQHGGAAATAATPEHTSSSATSSSATSSSATSSSASASTSSSSSPARGSAVGHAPGAAITTSGWGVGTGRIQPRPPRQPGAAGTADAQGHSAVVASPVALDQPAAAGPAEEQQAEGRVTGETALIWSFPW